jgi:hypothetical protein
LAPPEPCGILISAKTIREDIMPRIVLALIEDLSSCLDPSTKLLAGGDVDDKQLMAAQSACARLKQSSTDSRTIARLDAAAANIASELQRRQASKN